jgi:ribonuclease HIII
VTTELQDHLSSSVRKLELAGISVVQRKELPYGVQLKLKKGSRTCALNLYHSRKKGSSVIGSGGDDLLLKESLELLLEASSRGSLLLGGTRTGTDEAGKGDYFGPLVAAAVSCGEDAAGKLLSMGAGDSKRLSRKTVQDLYEKITEMDGIVYSVCALAPREYNRLFAGFSSRGMNSLDMQAMAHGKAIAGVLDKTGDAGTVVIDRFCDMKRLKPWLPDIPGSFQLLVKAEDKEPAVAAASIIARSVYLEQLALISRKYGMDLTPGAGAQVDATGRKLVSASGEGVLIETAKIHFSNTLRITRGLDRD